MDNLHLTGIDANSDKTTLRIVARHRYSCATESFKCRRDISPPYHTHPTLRLIWIKTFKGLALRPERSVIWNYFRCSMWKLIKYKSDGAIMELKLKRVICKIFTRKFSYRRAQGRTITKKKKWHLKLYLGVRFSGDSDYDGRKKIW